VFLLLRLQLVPFLASCQTCHEFSSLGILEAELALCLVPQGMLLEGGVLHFWGFTGISMVEKRMAWGQTWYFFLLV